MICVVIRPVISITTFQTPVMILSGSLDQFIMMFVTRLCWNSFFLGTDAIS